MSLNSNSGHFPCRRLVGGCKLRQVQCAALDHVVCHCVEGQVELLNPHILFIINFAPGKPSLPQTDPVFSSMKYIKLREFSNSVKDLKYICCKLRIEPVIVL